jgi:chromosome segregation ATPase
MTWDAADWVLSVLVVLLGAGGAWGYRKMNAEAALAKAEARKTEREAEVIEDGAAAQLRTAIKAADEELSNMRQGRYEMQDEMVVLRRDLAAAEALLADTTARLDVALGRIDRLEARLAAAGIDPASIVDSD